MVEPTPAAEAAKVAEATPAENQSRFCTQCGVAPAMSPVAWGCKIVPKKEEFRWKFHGIFRDFTRKTRDL